MDKKYLGMTVNERLYVSGLMDEFDEAVEKKDIEQVHNILEKVELTQGAIEQILERLDIAPSIDK